MCIAVLELVQAIERAARGLIRHGTDRERDQHLVGVQARVLVTQPLHLSCRNGLENIGRDQIDLGGDSRQGFECVEQHGRHRAEQLGGLACYDAPIL